VNASHDFAMAATPNQGPPANPSRFHQSSKPCHYSNNLGNWANECEKKKEDLANNV
jgi:hypothetical protein